MGAKTEAESGPGADEAEADEDWMTKLKKLKELRDMGALTKEEWLHHKQVVMPIIIEPAGHIVGPSLVI